MFFGRIVSLAMANAAVVGVFTEIPILSDYAFLGPGRRLFYLARRSPRCAGLLGRLA
jgi:hypothetical protein